LSLLGFKLVYRQRKIKSHEKKYPRGETEENLTLRGGLTSWKENKIRLNDKKGEKYSINESYIKLRKKETL